MPSLPPVWMAWAVMAVLVSAGLSWLALHYARARRLVDFPGHRRSHTVPTPRGGGIGIVVTVLIALPWSPWNHSYQWLLITAAVLMVAGIGWLDDHRPQPARIRFLVHLVAASLIALLFLLGVGNFLPVWLSVVVVALSIFWLTGCINAWNFMDGANGLLTSQCLWQGFALSIWFSLSGAAGLAPAWSFLALILAAACAGFLPFNFPRAAIFLGDVGSGALGLVCGLLLLAAMWAQPNDVWLLLLLPSALLVDATMTLGWRVIAGRRWYTAHREHLYQWLIRSGYSHARVAAGYMGWNLLVVLPACLVIWRWPSCAMPLVLSVLAVAALAWSLAKRTLYKKRLLGRRHRRVNGG